MQQFFQAGFRAACIANVPDSAAVWLAKLDAVSANAIAPESSQVDLKAEHPSASVEALRDLGAFGVQVPVEFGGLGYDNNVAAAVVERVARSCTSTAAILMFHYQAVNRTLVHAHPGRRAGDLTAMASGEMIAASAWTEPFGAAKKTDVRTAMRPVDSDRKAFIVNGAKSFCTGLETADVVDVLLRAEDVEGAGPTFVRLDAASPGVRVGEPYALMGLRGSGTCSVELDSVPARERDVLGGFGSAPDLMRSNHETPLNPGLIALGTSAAALEFAVSACSGAVAGVPPRTGDRRSLETVAEATMRVEAMYAYAAQLLRDMGRRPAFAYEAASRLKAHLSDEAAAVTRELMRSVGSLGFTQDLPLERHLRDAQATALMGPVNGLCRERIADGMLNDPEEDGHQ